MMEHVAMPTVNWILRCLAAAQLVTATGCGGGGADAEVRVPAGAGLPSGDRKPQPGSLPEKIAAHPASPCEWIPAGEVEAVVGKLSGPPRQHEGGCFYPLPVDSITLARRAKARQVQEALARAGMKSDWPAEPEDTGGVLIHVDVGVGAEERPSELAFATLGSWVGNDSFLAAKAPEDGWDYRRSLPGKPNFYGRAGTVMVVVQGGTYGMEDTTMATLAARVRDRIPDLPFPAPNAAASVPPGPDPCSVLSRAEAESVLGPLVVGPYRVRQGGSLADPGGKSCAYYSGKHRALLLTPHFTNGAGEMRSVRARGGLGLAGVVDRAAEGADTLEGPWDEVAIGVYGQLAMLKGGRMLEIAYLTSATDIPGAIRLAHSALPRLVAVR
jgi:hypothetical protein